jgi:predicted ATPase
VITSVRFRQDYRCFKKDDKFVFRPGVNLLVGDQGVGKSSLLKLIRETAGPDTRARVKPILTVHTSKEITMYGYDFEKDNPRVASSLESGNTLFAIQARFQSHGQVVQAIQGNVAGLSKKKGPFCFIMDEPDTGLSPRSAYNLVKQLNQLAKYHQILAAVHNPILIEAWPEVLSLEHRKWMLSSVFMETMLRGGVDGWHKKHACRHPELEGGTVRSEEAK